MSCSISMDSIHLICKHGLKSLLTKVHRGSCYEELVNKVCVKWPNLKVADTTFVYSIPEHDECFLENQEEFSCMLDFAFAFELKSIEVKVTDRSSMSLAKPDNSVVNGNEMVTFEGSNLACFDVCSVFNEPSIERPLLSAGWKNCLRHVNQQFEGGVIQFRAALIKYSLELGFTFSFSKNTRKNVAAYCENKKSHGCKWFVSASLCPTNNFFILKKFINIHDCFATVKRDKSKRLSSKVIASLIIDAVRDEKKIWEPNDVASHMLKLYGYDISYDKAWHALNKVNEKLFGSYADSYQQLIWYTRAAPIYNPGSYIKLEVDDNSRCFRRLFVAWGACIEGFNYIRPMLFIDGTHLKGKYKGCLLSATGKNANQELYPLAYAVVDAENQENWLWFLHHLRNVVGVDRRITFVSDRNPGLLDALPRTFPDCDHFFCLVHLKDNLRSRFSGVAYNKGFKERIIQLFTNCAYAPTPAIFSQCMNEFLREGGNVVARFLEGLPLQNWTNAFSGGNRYGEMTSNAAESFNAWVVSDRHLPITQMVDKIRTKLMTWFDERRKKSGVWHGLLCKDMEKQLQTYSELGRTWNIKMSSDYVIEVLSNVKDRVDFTNQTCTCYKWQLIGFPCVHAVACVNKTELLMENYVQYYWYASTYRRSYEKAIEPIPTSLRSSYETPDDPVINPPTTKRPPGRPKKKRYMSRGEKIKKKLVRCSRCNVLGHHNKKSCKAPI